LPASSRNDTLNVRCFAVCGHQFKERNVPKIRHLAVMCMNPDKLAKFYCDVFDMEVVARNGSGGVFLSDGYMNLALLKQQAVGKSPGLNHFGFHVEDADEIARRMSKWEVVGPEKRPADRTFAEQRGTDPEGNNFDIAEGGFDRQAADRKKAKTPVGA
jgi:catechol 2,3-dioxygenase-like lactoylglutathione lyase family enzyme